MIPDVEASAGTGVIASLLKLLASNAVVTVCTLLRDMAVAATFGATGVSDLYFLAVSIPVFLVSVAAGSYRSVVVPVLVRLRTEYPGSFRAVAARLLLVNVLAVGLTVLAAAIVIGGGYLLARAGEGTPGGPQLLWVMLLVLPMYALSALVELSQGTLQTVGALFLPNLSRAALPVGVIGGALAASAGAGLQGVVIGGTVGALAGAGSVAWQLRHFGLWPRTGEAHLPKPLSQQFLGNFRALVMATSITYISPLIGQWLAGLLGAGAVSALGYANRLTVGAAALITGSLTPVLLGFFSRGNTVRDSGNRPSEFVDVTSALAWAGSLMTLAFWIGSDWLISLLYQRGAFTADDADAVRLLADCYALQFPLLLAGTTATTMISAHSLNRVFVPIGIVLFVVNLGFSVALMFRFQAPGIAVASSLTYVTSVILLFWFLSRQGLVRLDRAALVRIVGPFALLGAAGGVVFVVPVRLTDGSMLTSLVAGAFLWLVFAAAAAAANRGLLRRLAGANWRS